MKRPQKAVFGLNKLQNHTNEGKGKVEKKD